MYRLTVLLCVSLMALAGCSKERLDRLETDAIILAFGDSLTAGVGSEEGYSYPEVLADLTQLNVISSGVPGEVSEQGAPRLAQELRRVRPDLLILLHGGNDILRNRPLTELKANLDAMIGMAQSRGAQVVLIAVPEKKLFSDAAPLYEELAEQHDLVLMDELLAELLRDPAMKSDAVHLNAAGYRALAEGIHAVLRNEGAL